MQVAAIIPALNEAVTVGAVAAAARSSPLVDDVVVVLAPSRWNADRCRRMSSPTCNRPIKRRKTKPHSVRMGAASD
jgi:hypothetical protein